MCLILHNVVPYRVQHTNTICGDAMMPLKEGESGAGDRGTARSYQPPVTIHGFKACVPSNISCSKNRVRSGASEGGCRPRRSGVYKLHAQRPHLCQFPLLFWRSCILLRPCRFIVVIVASNYREYHTGSRHTPLIHGVKSVQQKKRSRAQSVNRTS